MTRRPRAATLNTPTWLNPDKLCSFDEKVRVELGPQIIELDCTDENLRDEVTAPHYKIGARDAYGKVIRPDEAEKPADPAFGIVEKGEKMSCVDWRAKHVPHLWKVYVWEATPDDELIYREETEEERANRPEEDEGRNIIMVCINPGRFIKVTEFEDKDTALSHAAKLAGGM